MLRLETVKIYHKNKYKRQDLTFKTTKNFSKPNSSKQACNGNCKACKKLALAKI